MNNELVKERYLSCLKEGKQLKKEIKSIIPHTVYIHTPLCLSSISLEQIPSWLLSSLTITSPVSAMCECGANAQCHHQHPPHLAPLINKQSPKTPNEPHQANSLVPVMAEVRSILALSLPMVLSGMLLYLRSMISMLFLGWLGWLSVIACWLLVRISVLPI